MRHGQPPDSRRCICPPAPKALADLLLPWFDQHARPLPWRRTSDPYAIWVSEIMLQQTRVQTVVDYWKRWMRDLPNLAALAAAPSARVLKLWEGLGYYSRARRLQQAAQVIQTQHGGRFPESIADILALPGVGRYTAGAVASIAFNQPAPILDGNVVRVLCRIYGLKDDPRSKTANARLWDLAEQLVQATAHRKSAELACSRLNQSLMELGALICTPRQPSCARCPVARHCAAKAAGNPENLPCVGPRPTTIRRRMVAVIIEKRRKFLISQRPAKTVNGSLWEFPSIEWTSEMEPTPETLGSALNLTLQGLAPFAMLRHSITRYRIELTALRATAASSPAGRWVSRKVLATLPMSAAHRKLAQRLLHPSA